MLSQMVNELTSEMQGYRFDPDCAIGNAPGEMLHCCYVETNWGNHTKQFYCC